MTNTAIRWAMRNLSKSSAITRGGLSKKLASTGAEIVVKNTVWTEFALAATGDYLLIGVSAEADPVVAGADEVRQVIRHADTFERLADDYAILTGV